MKVCWPFQVGASFADPFHVNLCYAILSVPRGIFVACWEGVASFLSYNVVLYSFVAFPCGVRCDAWLYQFLNFVFFFTLNNKLICIKYLRKGKDIDKPANTRSLIKAPAFLTVFTLFLILVWGVFDCICLYFLALFVLILYVSANSYTHVETVSSPNHTFSFASLT